MATNPIGCPLCADERAARERAEAERERIADTLGNAFADMNAAEKRADAAESALAQARDDADGLRNHLRRMIEWADLHVREVEGIADATKAPEDRRRARAARAEYDFACAALAAAPRGAPAPEPRTVDAGTLGFVSPEYERALHEQGKCTGQLCPLGAAGEPRAKGGE